MNRTLVLGFLPKTQEQKERLARLLRIFERDALIIIGLSKMLRPEFTSYDKIENVKKVSLA